MAKVLIHATISLDGLMAGTDGGVDWMHGFDVRDEDLQVVRHVTGQIGAIVAGATPTQTIEEGEEPYGGTLDVPVYLMTHTAHAPITKDGVTYHFVVDDIKKAVSAAKESAGDKYVSLIGGSVSRQCLSLGLVDEIQLHVVPVVLGDGVSLFSGLDKQIRLERLETLAFASETHLRFRVVK